MATLQHSLVGSRLRRELKMGLCYFEAALGLKACQQSTADIADTTFYPS